MTVAFAVFSAGRVDLHSHSTASDGALSPGQLVRTAAVLGLTGLALTDHDTVDGLAEFLAAGRGTSLKLVGGVEISLDHSGTFHLLGLNVAGDIGLPAALSRLKTFRVDRNIRMLDRIGRLGYHISWEILLEAARGGQLGRPHFADILVARGFFKNRDEVFEKLLGKGCPGYVDKIHLSPEEGLSMIRAAGWAPVLAHPVSLGLATSDWLTWLGRLTDGGLLGLEVYHPSHSQEQSDFLGGLARRFGLVPTAGSDFHSEAKSASLLGWTLRNSPFGWEMVEELRNKLNSKR